MRHAIRNYSARLMIAPALAASLLGGCAWNDQYPRATSSSDFGSRTVDYPGGRYTLYGDGTSSSPYYWVWIPAGSNPPAPPPLPPGRVVAAAPEGRYQLYGDGSSASPYYYVWVPAGATTVVPPPPPLRRQ